MRGLLRAGLLLSSLVLMTTVTGVASQSYNQSVQLMRDLFANYDVSVRPLLDQSKVLTVSTDMLLAAITRVDEKEQTISVRIYFYLWWQDELLTWSPEDYGNVTVINPLLSQVWIPTFNLAGAASDQQLLVDTSYITPLSVNYTGTVIWFPNVFMSQLCKMDMKKFPYDQHNCTFLLYTVLYGTNQMNVTHLRESPSLSEYSVNGEWELISTEVAIEIFSSGISLPVYYIRLSLTIRRRPRYFLLNLLFPTLALSFLNILVFVLPADSGEKVGYSITVLLSVMLMMGVTTDVMPESSDVVPLITQFLTALTLISVLSVVATVIILFVHHKQEQDTRKKNSAISFIQRLKQKVASRKSVQPVNSSTPNGLNIHPKEDAVMSFENEHPPEGEEEETKCANSSLTHSDNNGLALVEAMKNTQRCTSPDLPRQQGDAPMCRGHEALFAQNNQAESEILRQGRGAGGLASLWFRGKQHHHQGREDDGCSLKPSEQHVKPGETIAGETSRTDEVFKQLSRHVNLISFWIFLAAWLAITLGYMVALFT